MLSAGQDARDCRVWEVAYIARRDDLDYTYLWLFVQRSMRDFPWGHSGIVATYLATDGWLPS